MPGFLLFLVCLRSKWKYFHSFITTGNIRIKYKNIKYWIKYILPNSVKTLKVKIYLKISELCLSIRLKGKVSWFFTPVLCHLLVMVFYSSTRGKIQLWLIILLQNSTSSQDILVQFPTNVSASINQSILSLLIMRTILLTMFLF